LPGFTDYFTVSEADTVLAAPCRVDQRGDKKGLQFDFRFLLHQPLNKLPIAFVVDAFPTITETFIVDQIADLRDRGIEVEIFAFDMGMKTHVSSRYARYLHSRGGS
jgi:hypothetical protein